MLWVVILPVLFVFNAGHNQDENGEKDDYDDILQVINKLSSIYENPTTATYRQLLDLSILYLDKLLNLEYDVKAGRPKAERLIRVLHEKGASEQLENVPYSLLIGRYDWNSMDMAEYENIVFRAKQIWKYFLDEINYGSFGKATTPGPRRYNPNF